ncbi:ROK family transcriptional regulator [Krasilnikoviella flava]|uniref:Sugar kinase of the NBD/HSP70 family, may contain an N-terminal HTH domain n=1 Tax=Krasilnikoviella flava TaxID=526729 RepID=A0A1T5LZZ3_9MICO|nr:ROK family transcriptional regulator [Krasilnikoviella flava]SKC81560.1 Sugar kinase of the NBD/HSP70 family, may contain an N-terminal HTH domain [Krasilnikoviella flava]
MRATTMPQVGARNELVVLRAIRVSPEGVDQSSLMERCGLSRQAVSQITRRLIERGLVRAAPVHTNRPGKPALSMRVEPRAMLAAGAHLDPAHITVTVVDMLARPILKRFLAPPCQDPAADVERIGAALDEMLHELGAAVPDGQDEQVHSGIQGIGVAVPGGIDAAHGRMLDPPWLPGWRGVPLLDLIRERTGLPAVLDKDTNAALTAECWPGRFAAQETVLYLYVGAGVGSAVAGDGTIHRGSTVQAGEIGHLPTGMDDTRCACGRMSCLMLYTDMDRFLEKVRRAGVPVESHARTTTALDLVQQRARGGDDVARRLIEEYGTALGEAARTLISIHDPHRVVIGGPYWGYLAEHATPQVARGARRSRGGSHEVSVASSTFGDDVGAIGAATLFLERKLSPATT